MLDGKTWWVTGASSGIGAGLAEAVSDRGARVILSGRDEARLAAVAARCRGATLVLPFEATDFARMPALVDKAWSWAAGQGGRIDCLVNNAGVSQRSFAVDTVFDVYQKIIDIDLLAPIALTQALLPRMVGAGGGTLIAISSIAGIVGAPLRSAYSAAKHGLIGYHDSVRCETAHLGMRVLVVAPGAVATDVSRNALDAAGKPRGFSDDTIDNGMTTAVAAKRILDALAAGEHELILADGAEADLARLRRSDPNALFALAERMVAEGYGQKFGVAKK